MPIAKLGKNYWSIPLRSRRGLYNFRVHDVGRPHSNERLSAINRRTGRWVTYAWHIHKDNVKVRGNTLTATNKRTQKILDSIRSQYGAIIVKK